MVEPAMSHPTSTPPASDAPTPRDPPWSLDRPAWSHRDVAVRCAAARTTGERGGPDDIAFLVERALEDRSVAVRLAASTAAADVLSRHRAPGALSEAQALAIWALLRPVDPGRNPGLLQVCGELRHPDATRRVLAALRDGRHDVRIGAVVGVHRHAASGWCDPSLETKILATASERSVPADTRAALVRVCADVGWTDSLPIAEALAASDLETVAATAGEALDWIRTPHPVEGLWADTRRDAWEAGPPCPSPRAVWGFVQGAPRAVLVETDGVLSWRDVCVGATTDAEPAVAAPPAVTGVRVRTLRLSVEGGPRRRVLLAGAHLLVPATAVERSRFLDALVDAGADDALDWIDPTLPPDATTLCARGRRALRAGNPTQARSIFAAAALLPRPPADLPRWVAAAEAALGTTTLLPRARKRPPRTDP